MIVDCYTHIWHSADQLGRCLPTHHALGPTPAVGLESDSADTERHWSAGEPVDAAFVLGFTSRFLEAEIPNDEVADYVRQHPDRLVGFAGIDPSRPKEAIEELHRTRQALSMKGVAIAPAAQDFHPSNSQAMLVYAEAAKLGMPVVFHAGVFDAAASKLAYARPLLLDDIANELPSLKIVIAHLGHPWVNETLMLLAKHQNVFAETSRLIHQPWQAYQALLSAYQYGVMDKLLFGSGFPGANASQCIEALYSINHLVHGTNLPTIPREQIRGIIERDTLGLLGLSPMAEPAPETKPDTIESV